MRFPSLKTLAPSSPSSTSHALSAAGKKVPNAHTTKKRPGREIGRGGLENGSRGLTNTPRSII